MIYRSNTEHKTVYNISSINMDISITLDYM